MTMIKRYNEARTGASASRTTPRSPISSSIEIIAGRFVKENHFGICVSFYFTLHLDSATSHTRRHVLSTRLINQATSQIDRCT